MADRDMQSYTRDPSSLSMQGPIQVVDVCICIVVCCTCNGTVGLEGP